MMPEDCPKCMCGAHEWNPGGGSFGGMSQQWFQCNVCKRWAMDLWAHSCGCFLISDHKVEGEDFKPFIDYINEVILVTFRIEGDKIEKARRAIVDKWWDKFRETHNVPEGIRLGDLRDTDPEAYEVGHKEYDAILNSTEYRRPAGYEKSPMTPKLPVGLEMYRHVFVDGKSDWELVDHNDTMALLLPVDPILIENQEYYRPIFQKLAEELAIKIVPVEVQNRYCGTKNEPWYLWQIGNVEFVVGPRKRVTSIQVTAPNGIDTDAIRTIAQADNVTYTAEGHWQDTRQIAKALEVHAWSKEKLEEYLRALLMEVKKHS